MLKDSYLDLLLNVGSFKPKYILIRNVLISIAAVLLMQLSFFIAKELEIPKEHQFAGYVIIILAFISASEVNLLLINLLGKFPRFRSNFFFQAICLVANTYLLSYLWIKIAEKLLAHDNILQYPVTQILLINGVLIMLIHLLMIVISKLTKTWIDSRKEIEGLKQAKLLSDYNLLKDRLNPHFLFNNLSVLKSLIRYNPKNAEKFTQNFTNVYRYVLKSHEEKTVSLHEELKFLESYISLHKERIGEGLKVDIHIPETLHQKRIPPLTLQLLVENAIKHNVASKNKPLNIQLLANENSLTVSNNVNKKDTTYSTHTGLKTLQAQYKLLNNKAINIVNNKNYYNVKIPLL